MRKVVRQMWPFIGEYIKETLMTVVQPSIQSNLPSNLKSFKFESIDTGDIVSTLHPSPTPPNTRVMGERGQETL